MGDKTDQSSKLRVPFGERDGTMHPPDQVARGLKCQCTCPGCGNALVANHGNQKRHYFSHYRSPECRAGYESALHKMGKQIIQEHSRVMLASHAIPVEVELIDGDVIRDKAMFEARSSDLTWVHTEKSVESWRPDLIAGLKNGATIHIEIGVTHFVDNDKAHGLDNVLEIDLSAIAPETARDIDALREAVIDRAPRRWHRVSLYDDLERVKETRRRLEREAEKLNAQIRKRFQQQQQKALNLERKRREYVEHLDTLMQMSDPAVQHELRQTRREQWSEALGEMQDNIAAFCAHRELGVEHVGMALDGDWIVQAHPVVWQFHVLSNTSTSL